MTKIEKTNKLDTALKKLKKLLELAPTEDKEKLRKELSKMVAENENASVYPKIGWSFHDSIIQTGTTFKVVPCFTDTKINTPFELYANLLKISDFDVIDKFIEGFDIILSEKPDKIRIGLTPATKLGSKTMACRISFKILL